MAFEHKVVQSLLADPQTATHSVTMSLRGRLAAAGAGVLVGAAAALAAPALRDKLKPKWSHPLGMHE